MTLIAATPATAAADAGAAATSAVIAGVTFTLHRSPPPRPVPDATALPPAIRPTAPEVEEDGEPE
jgi:hypothetical protein